MSKLLDINSIKNIDYEKVGLKCGLEIHQQLDTGKLFCSCPCIIVPNSELNKSVNRRLRFSLSETGEIDAAAAHEFKKGKYNIYKYNDEITCLVDLDEAPPVGPNKDALSAAIRVSNMLHLKFFDKLSFMRKLIINGSVTGGFQRTSMLGMGGYLETSFGRVEIDGVNIEEDSCRTLENFDGHTIYSLDRQGIPLIEITTGPQIKTPTQGYEVAYQLGNLLRSFPETKRGLGTIRQDLNVSIIGGSRIEIKGAQNLKLIPQAIDAEIKRQMVWISIIDELKVRKIDSTNFSDNKVYDITKLFSKTTSKVVLSNLEIKGSGVYAIKLNKFKNILGTQMHEGYRFASEISDRNKAHFPSIKGLFHGDELPKYGIEQSEVDLIRKELKLEKDDNFILIVNEKNVANKSLNYVLEIIGELIKSVPSEVRQVDPKGTLTTFSRPMPGAARMYPETDIEELILTKEYLDEQAKNIPELYDKKLDRLKHEFKLEEARVEEMLSTYSEEQIRNLIGTSQKGAANIYNIIFEIPKDIKKREKIEPINFKYELLESIIKAANDNLINQNTIRDIFISLYKDNLDNVSNLKDYLDKKGLIQEVVDESIVEDKIKLLIEKNPKAPFGALMGMAMKEFKGGVDGSIISKILKRLM